MQPTYWPIKYTKQAIAAAFLLNLIILVIFGSRAKAFHWLLINFLLLVFYFYKINTVSIRLQKSSSRHFTQKLFWIAWTSRLVFMFIIYLIALNTWERPFYISAVDATRYHRVAAEVADLIHTGRINEIIGHVLEEYEGLPDNIGVPVVIGSLYAIFGSYGFLAKLFFTFIGTGTVLLVYKTTRLLWDESVARLAGIMMAFFPMALFYSSVILKEEFVVFLSMLAIYITTKTVKTNKITLWNMVLLVLAMGSLFFFRTAAGALIVALVVATLILNRFGGNLVVSVFIAGIIFTAFVFFIDVFGELTYYWERIAGYDEFSEKRIEDVSTGNVLATIVGTPFYIALSFISPFPAMVFTSLYSSDDHDATYYWIAGLTIWNFLVYFGIIGLWRTLKTNKKESLTIWGFAAGYTVILGLTAMFTSVRFGYNAMPAFFIMIAVGIHNRQKFMNWSYYLVIAVSLILAWNIFRLAGRGVI